MYLRSLRIRHLKLIADLALDFTTSDSDDIRLWTLIIGRNGTGKTSILQAIALAAAGQRQVNTLGKSVVGHLRDRRSTDPMEVTSSFLRPKSRLKINATASLAPDESSINAQSRFVDVGTNFGADQDPIDWARGRNEPDWFVAGYGVARFLPDVGSPVKLEQPSIERLAPLFDPRAPLASTNFSTFFQGDKALASAFHAALKKALFNVKEMLPGIRDLELRGQGGVRKAGDLLERNRFTQVVGSQSLKVPGVALAHGHQSAIAWIADLIGHIILESGPGVGPSEMQGLVLVDEIELYLHPTWQAALVPALKKTFPKLQFIVTTHAPIVLSGCAPDEVVRIDSWGDDGDVVEVVHDAETGALRPRRVGETTPLQPDTRMMTSSEIVREYFGVDGLTPNPVGPAFRRYNVLASDPLRSDVENSEMLALKHELTRAGIDAPKAVRHRKSP
jgi:predicted ATPase